MGREVLIVGAGPTGLVAAIELARRKIPIRLIEEAERPALESRAAGIWPRTLEVFERLGVIGEILARGNPVNKLRAYSGTSEVFCLRLDTLESRYPFILALSQADTEAILTERLKELGGKIERQVKLLSLESSDSGVTSILMHGDKKKEPFQSSWVLGCDGAHSQVRKQLGLDFKGAAYDFSFAVADARLDWDMPSDGGVLFFCPQGPVITFPFKGNRHCRIIIQLDLPPNRADKPHGEAEKLSLEALENILRDRLPVPFRVSDPLWISSFSIHHRVVPHFSRGRAFVVGDAAHVHSPAGGQGMNTSIQDAFNLGWKLALVERGEASPRLLDSYEIERLPVAKTIVRGTDLLTRMVTLRRPWSQALRNRLAGLVIASSAVQKRIAEAASGLNVSYRNSPIVGENSPAGNPRAGDRAPDRKLGASGRLYDWLSATENALLLFSPSPQDIREAEQRFGSWAKILTIGGEQDPEGTLHNAYGAKGAALFWIRPDGYIGYRGLPSDLSACETFLRSVFNPQEGLILGAMGT